MQGIMLETLKIIGDQLLEGKGIWARLVIEINVDFLK